jgi:hypothetical protein
MKTTTKTKAITKPDTNKKQQTTGTARPTAKYPERFGRYDADADLGVAMVITETEDGACEPIAPVSTINEGREVARHNLARRIRHLEQGSDPTCPAIYRVWSPNFDGEYAIAAEFDAARMASLASTISPCHGTRRTAPASPRPYGTNWDCR